MMKKDYYPDRTICSLQLELKKLHKDLRKKFTQKCDINFTSFMVEREKYLETLDEMYKISKSIHYKSTRMEKRLLKYFRAVVGLGFIRKRK